MKEFLFKMQVYFEDVDSFGIVHHANFIRYMERARLAWWLELGFRLDELFKRGMFFVVRKIDIDYFAPARLYDELEVVTRVVSIRPVAKVYEQVIRSAHDPNLIFCKAKIHVVCVNEKLRPQAMPQQWLENML